MRRVWRSIPITRERAKELLAEAGYPDGFTTTFVCPTSGSGNMFPQIMNEYIQKCAEEVGIHIELDMSESERVWDVMKVGFKDEYADVGALNTSFYTMFRQQFLALGGGGLNLTAGDAMLVYLSVYRYADACESTPSQMKQNLEKLWDEVKVLTEPQAVALSLEPKQSSRSPLSKMSKSVRSAFW